MGTNEVKQQFSCIRGYGRGVWMQLGVRVGELLPSNYEEKNFQEVRI